jgi:hypothetical protein
MSRHSLGLKKGKIGDALLAGVVWHKRMVKSSALQLSRSSSAAPKPSFHDGSDLCIMVMSSTRRCKKCAGPLPTVAKRRALRRGLSGACRPCCCIIPWVECSLRGVGPLWKRADVLRLSPSQYRVEKTGNIDCVIDEEPFQPWHGQFKLSVRRRESLILWQAICPEPVGVAVRRQ